MKTISDKEMINFLEKLRDDFDVIHQATCEQLPRVVFDYCNNDRELIINMIEKILRDNL